MSPTCSASRMRPCEASARHALTAACVLDRRWSMTVASVPTGDWGLSPAPAIAA